VDGRTRLPLGPNPEAVFASLANPEDPMSFKNPTKLFPLFLTERLDETRSFYEEKLGFTVLIDMPEYIQLQYGGAEGPELCFMKPDAFPDGMVRPAFQGEGVVVSIPTPCADDKFREVTQHRVETTGQPENKPWGWRSFFAVDPNGILLDFFHVYKEMPKAVAEAS
jgi:catechol 2,3-dioxygenase-like lactoylglutathione lyase family enzyme